jgi:hypothetical protein
MSLTELQSLLANWNHVNECFLDVDLVDPQLIIHLEVVALLA